MNQSHHDEDVPLKYIEVGIGTSSQNDSYQAGLEAAEMAILEIIEHELSLILVFASSRFELDKLAKGIKEVVDDVEVIGTTTAGEIGDTRIEDSVVVLALASPFLEVKVGIGTKVADGWEKSVEEATTSPAVSKYFQEDYSIYGNLIRSGKSVFGFLFNPGVTIRAESQSHLILQELIQRSQSRIPFFGGASADDWKLQENYVIHNEQVYPNSILVAIIETNLSFGVGMAHGYSPSEKRFTVTKVEGHEILEIEEKPAAEELSRILDFSIEDSKGKHLGLITNGTIGYRREKGDYVLNIPAMITKRGGVILSHPVPQGAQLTVMETTKDKLVEASRVAFRRANLRGQISKPAVCIIFSCALRAAILGEEANQEILTLKEANPDIPMAGFYSFGEQTISNEGINEHCYEVISVLSIADSLSPSAEVALENKQLLRELSISESAHRALLVQMPDAVFAVDNTGKVSHWNPKAQQILGFSEEYCIGKKLETIFGKDAESLHILTQQDNSTEIFSSELYLTAFSGVKIPFLITASHNPDQPYFTDVFILHDISHRIEMRNALMDSEKKYRNLIENSIEGIAIAYMDQFAFVNQSFCTLLERTSDELLEARMPEIMGYIHPSDRPTLARLEEAWKEEQSIPNRVEFRIITKDNKSRWIEMYPQKIIYNGKPAIQILAHNITIRKTAIEALSRERSFFRTLAEVSIEKGSIESLCKRVLASLIENYNLSIGTIQLCDEEENELVLVASQGIESYRLIERMKIGHFKDTDFVAAHVAFTKKPIITPSEDGLVLPKKVTDRIQQLKLKSTITYPILRGDSSLIGVINLASSGFAIFAEHDRVFFETAITMIATAIEKIIAEEKIAEAKDLFEKTFVSQRDAIFILSRSEPPIIIDCNPMANEIFGYPRDEILGKELEFLATDESAADRLTTQLQYNIERRGFVQISDFKLKDKYGKERDTDITAILLRKESGGNIGFLVVIRDITKEKQDAEALKRSEMRYKTVLQSLNDLLFVFDEDNRYTQFYSARRDLLALPEEKFIGKRVDKVLDEEAGGKLAEILNHVRETGENGYIEYELEFGSEIRYFAGSVSVQDDGKTCTLIVRDVTERKQAENDLRTSYRDLELYTSLLRHDIANDLQIILTQTGLLDMKFQGEHSEYTDAIKAASERMNRVLTIFGVSEKESEQNLRIMLQNIADQAMRVHPGLVVNIDCSNQAEAIKIGIGRLLPMAFDNLLRNSAMFAGSNPVVDIKIRKSGNSIQIDFTDNGQGIPKHLQNNVFQRGVSTTGGGLGLYLTKRVLEGYGASIELIKSRTKGAHFRVTYPIK